MGYRKQLAVETGEGGGLRSATLRLLLSFPSVAERLQTLAPLEAMYAVAQVMPEPPIQLQSPSVSTVPAAVRTVTRYTDISCPHRIWLKADRVSVVVRLTVKRPEQSGDIEALDVEQDASVLVRVTAPAFRILSAAERPIAVLPDADSETSFDLRPLLPGLTRISFDFMQNRNVVGTANVAVEIAESDVTVVSERLLSQIVRKWRRASTA